MKNNKIIISTANSKYEILIGSNLINKLDRILKSKLPKSEKYLIVFELIFVILQELGKVKKAGEKKLLSSYHDSWKQFSRGIDYLHKLYLYLNTQHIKKQKLSDAELTYGSLSVEATEQMKEIGELGLHIWKTQMIEPLEKDLVGQLLEVILTNHIPLPNHIDQ